MLNKIVKDRNFAKNYRKLDSIEYGFKNKLLKDSRIESKNLKVFLKINT